MKILRSVTYYTTFLILFTSIVILLALQSIPHEFQTFIIPPYETHLVSPNGFIFKSLEFLEPLARINTYIYSDTYPNTSSFSTSSNYNFTIPKDHIKVWKIQFSSEGYVRLLANWRDSALTFCVAFGETTDDIDQCVLKEVSSTGLYIEYNVTTPGDYSFIFASLDNEVEGSIEFDVEKKQYQLQYAEDMYKGTFYLDIPFLSRQYFIMHNPLGVPIETKLNLGTRKLELVLINISIQTVLSTIVCFIIQFSQPRDILDKSHIV